MHNYYIKINNKTNIFTYPLASLSLPQGVCNENMQHSALSASVTICYDSQLLQLLVQNAVLQAQIFNENDVILFTGEINTDINWLDDGALSEIKDFSLTVKDYSEKFKIKTTADILLEDTTLNEAVAQLVKPIIDKNPNLSISANLPAIPIQVVYVPKDKYILDTLEALVYQYGFSFYFDNFGIMQFFDWRTIPSDCPNFGSDKIQTGFNVSKTNKNYTGVQVSFNTLTTKQNELVYFQGNGYDSNDNPAPFVIQPGVYFPYESTPVYEKDHGQVYQSFATGYAEAVKKYNGEYDYQRNGEAKLLYSKNHYVEPEWETGIQIDRTDFELTRASVRLVNKGSKDANVYKLGIRADAVYRNAASTCTLGISQSDGGNVFNTQFEYVYTMEQAESTAKSLLAYFSQGNYKIKFKTQSPIQSGTFLNLNTGASGFCAKVFVYKTTLDGEKQNYTVECQTINQAQVDTKKSSVAFSDAGGAAVAAISSLKNSLIEGNGDYIPELVTNLKAIAQRDQIAISFDSANPGLKNSVCDYQIELSRDKGKTWQSFSANSTQTAYTFDRTIDGYPEADELENWRIKVRAKNIYGNYSPFSEAVAVNADAEHYGTWQLLEPTINAQGANRAILLSFSQIARADKREVYGTIQYKVQICRPDIDHSDGELVYYKPATNLDPYTAETNYKDGTGFVIAGKTYSQTMPLKGQNEQPEAPTYTMYSFKVCAFNEACQSAFAIINETARPTSCYDVVKGWEYNEKGEKVKIDGALGATNIYTKDLASLSANLGDIKAGNLHSEILPGEKSPNVLVDLDKEEFRVGNNPSLEEANSKDAEYIHWKKGEGLFLKLKNFLLDATGSLMRGGLQVMGMASDLFRTLIDSFGVYIEQFKEDAWQSFAKIYADQCGNFCITNDPNYDPLKDEGVLVENAEIFHLNGDLLSETGKNLSEYNIQATGTYTINGIIPNRLLLSGAIKTDLCNFDSVLKTVNKAIATGLTTQNSNAYNTAWAILDNIMYILSIDGKTLQRYNYISKTTLAPITATVAQLNYIESETIGFEADENGICISWLNPQSEEFANAQIIVQDQIINLQDNSFFVLENEDFAQQDQTEITIVVQSLLTNGTIVEGKTIQWVPGTVLSESAKHTSIKQSATVAGTFNTNALIKDNIFYCASRTGTNLVRIDLVNETYLSTITMLNATTRDYIMLDDTPDSPYIVSIVYGTNQIFAERYNTQTGVFNSKSLITFSGRNFYTTYSYWQTSLSYQRTYGNVPYLVVNGTIYALCWAGFKGCSSLNGTWYTISYEWIYCLRLNIASLTSYYSTIQYKEDTTWNGGSAALLWCESANGSTHNFIEENFYDSNANVIHLKLNYYEWSVNLSTLSKAGYYKDANLYKILKYSLSAYLGLMFYKNQTHIRKYPSDMLGYTIAIQTNYPVYNALCTGENTLFAISTCNTTIDSEEINGTTVYLYQNLTLTKAFYFKGTEKWTTFPFMWQKDGNLYAYNPLLAEIICVEPATTITGFNLDCKALSFWLKGNANFYGFNLAPNDNLDWRFYTMELKSEEKDFADTGTRTVCTLPYTVYNQSGTVILQNEVTDEDLDLFACDFFDIKGLLQEFMLLENPLSQEQIEHALSNNLHFSISGLSADKTALVINAKNPSNVKTNCLALKGELPLYFVYCQFPLEPEPAKIFIGTWVEITEQYTSFLTTNQAQSLRLWKRIL